MNKGCFRLIFNRVRHMMIAVADFAVSRGASSSGASTSSPSAKWIPRALALAAIAAFGSNVLLASAQIVAAPGSGAQVIQTQNGLNQVNIARPSAAGVSVGTFSQFDVPSKGAILNNSPTIVQTQQGGYINGNPNLTPGNSARIIVNQVLSNAPSQLKGYLEVAGQKAEVIVTNPNGLVVDGGGFINTSRAILTTGTPNYGANGSLTGFTVNGGNISVQGAGLNATNVDQVDLLARAIQVNAAIYANNLNVIAGANQVDHDTLSTTQIAGSGAAPALAIDVGQLGGMYANRIFLASNEYGVGVSTRGILAAQAGDLTLASNGQLVLGGTTNASGSLSVSARGGIDNSGVTYAQHDVNVSTSGTLTNGGTLAAQQNLHVDAASVASTGTLGAGINQDGSVAKTGDLNVTATGALNVNGRNAAGGNASFAGASLSLAGSSTTANGNLALTASAGDLNTSSATTTAGNTINATAASTFINDNGALKSGGTQSITAGALSNRNGQIISGDALTANIVNAVSNQGGTMQASGTLNVSAASVDNTSGHVASLGGNGVTLVTSGALNNGANGQIASNGNVNVQAGQLVNAGSITAMQSLIARAVQSMLNSGTLAANGAVTLSAGTTLTNSGSIAGNQLTLSAIDLINRNGTITQAGTSATTFAITGTLDNTSGSIGTNADDLLLAPAALFNDNGTITSSGAGTLTVRTGNGALSNNGGTIATNGALQVTSGALANRGGTLAGQSSVSLDIASLDNRDKGYVGASNVSINDAGRLDNTGGTVQANGAMNVAAQDIANDSGSIANGSTAATTVTARGALSNANGGVIGGNGDVSVSGASIDNTNGTLMAGGSINGQSGGTFTNRSGLMQAGQNVSVSAAGAIDNTAGQIEADGATSALSMNGATLDNANGRIANSGTGATSVFADTIVNSNANGVAGAGTIGGNGDVTLDARVLSNTNGAQVLAGHDLSMRIAQLADNTAATLSGANALTLEGPNAALLNSGGSVHANGALSLNTASIDNTNGRIGNDQGSGGSVSIATSALANQGGAIGSDQNLALTTNTLSGDGRIVAGNDGALTINGDYTLDTANHIQANHDLAFTIAGDFTNQGTLAAIDALTLNARNIDNQAGADLNSASTTVNAQGALTNEGRIEGDTVSTTGATLVNTGTIIGDVVTVNGSVSVLNTGAAAVMAAASELNVYSRGDIRNDQGANLFSLGDINIAGDATRDANGLLVNRANSVTNDQSAIEAQGNIEVAAATLTNTRPAPTVETVTTGIDTVHQTKRDKYIGCTTTGGDSHAGCGDARWQHAACARARGVSGARERERSSAERRIDRGGRCGDSRHRQRDEQRGDQGRHADGDHGHGHSESRRRDRQQRHERHHDDHRDERRGERIGAHLGEPRGGAGGARYRQHDAGRCSGREFNNAKLDTSGNATLTGSTLSADKGAASIVASGDVTLNEAREEHDDYSYRHAQRGSALHQTVTDDMQSTRSNIGVGSTVSFGSSSSKSTLSDDSTQRNGSNITAGGTASFIAKGNGTAGSGNVTIAGSTVNASDVMLAANNQVNLVNSTDTDSNRSKNESSSGSIGVFYGSSGYGVEASGSRAHGNANSDSTAQNNTHISGTNSVSIVSGGDTNIKGATVNGGQVSALIGGDLNIASVQDTSQSAAHQESQSAGVSISQGGGSASYSQQKGDAHGDYNGVEEQSGIHAGAGGFDLNVKGNTDLHGAYISSDADASKNSLTTGTLSFSDITNNSNYDAKSSGFSAGGSMGAADSAKANGVTSLSNGGGVSPMIAQHDSGNETATTKSAIGAGTINITNGANQTQDIASLSRDTTDLNGTVSKLPDLNNLLNQQASTQQAAAIVAQTVATQIGNYAQGKKDVADKAAAQAEKDGDLELAAQYKQEAASWDTRATRTNTAR